MPVRIPDDDEDVPEPVVELLEEIDENYPHEHCLFFADTAGGGGPWSKSQIWMYYPDDNNYAPEGHTFLHLITNLVEDMHPSTYAHVGGMANHDYPDDVPDGAIELTKISPKNC